MELLDILAYLILATVCSITVLPILDAVGGGNRKTGAFIIGTFLGIIGFVLSISWASIHLLK